MNTELIFEVANLIRDDDDKDFDMQVLFHDCGSPGCIVGWTLYAKDWEKNTVPLYARETNKYSELKTEAREALGISDDQADTLFAPTSERHGYDYRASDDEGEYITAKLAADVLDHLAISGRVDWGGYR